MALPLFSTLDDPRRLPPAGVPPFAGINNAAPDPEPPAVEEAPAPTQPAAPVFKTGLYRNVKRSTAAPGPAYTPAAPAAADPVDAAPAVNDTQGALESMRVLPGTQPATSSTGQDIFSRFPPPVAMPAPAAAPAPAAPTTPAAATTPASAQIAARNQAVTAARQARNAASGRLAEASELAEHLNKGRDEDSPLQRNLAAALTGQQIDPKWTQRYLGAGILEPVDDGNGGQSLQVSERGLSLMPRQVQQTVRTARARQSWQDQQAALLTEFPRVGVADSPENATFMRAFQAVGSDPRRALAVARAVLGGG